MKEYFHLVRTLKPKGIVAMASMKPLPPIWEVIEQIEGKNEFPYTLKLKHAYVKKTMMYDDDLSSVEEIWPDYMCNHFAYVMVSERFRDIINAELTGNEGIDWVSVKIEGNGEWRTYYILRFNKPLDVLNMELTSFNGDGSDPTDVFQACFSLEKISKYAVFNKPRPFDFWRLPITVYVSKKLKKALQKEKLTGVGFEDAYIR